MTDKKPMAERDWYRVKCEECDSKRQKGREYFKSYRWPGEAVNEVKKQTHDRINHDGEDTCEIIKEER